MGYIVVWFVKFVVSRLGFENKDRNIIKLVGLCTLGVLSAIGAVTAALDAAGLLIEEKYVTALVLFGAAVVCSIGIAVCYGDAQDYGAEP